MIVYGVYLPWKSDSHHLKKNGGSFYVMLSWRSMAHHVKHDRQIDVGGAGLVDTDWIQTGGWKQPTFFKLKSKGGAPRFSLRQWHLKGLTLRQSFPIGGTLSIFAGFMAGQGCEMIRLWARCINLILCLMRRNWFCSFVCFAAPSSLLQTIQGASSVVASLWMINPDKNQFFFDTKLQQMVVVEGSLDV